MCEVAIKKRDAERTRGRILSAAQHVFARRPYAEASLKEITSRAKANPALVSRYFGSKEKLFEAALSAALDAKPLMPPSKSAFGETIMATFLRPDRGSHNPLPMLIFATAETGLQSIAIRLLKERILTPLALWLGEPEARLRATRVMVVATGFFTYRSLLPLEEMQGDLDPSMRAWLVESFQSAIDTTVSQGT